MQIHSSITQISHNQLLCRFVLPVLSQLIDNILYYHYHLNRIWRVNNLFYGYCTITLYDAQRDFEYFDIQISFCMFIGTW